MNYFEELNIKLHSLVIFRSILSDRVLSTLSALLTFEGKNHTERVSCYSEFSSRLFSENINLTDYIWQCVLSNENIYVIKKAKNEDISPVLEKCLNSELEILQELSQLNAQQIKDAIDYVGFLPFWENEHIDFNIEYQARIANISTLGYGIFAENFMFSIIEGRISPVLSPDPIRLSDLKGYERERKIVVDNTLALFNNKPAANVLLYGDAGTGKSSTIKAIVNEYANLGLRLIEVKKNQLLQIPRIVEELSINPLKFILFIDDLSFIHNNEEIGVLKAILEGSASAKTPNVAIYATSNRRHIVKETFSDRGNDDVHRSETIQEQTSLSDRFGLSVNFIKPNKDLYLSIVHELILQHGIEIDEEQINLLAERHALDRGGRSPRVAKQFVEKLLRE